MQERLQANINLNIKKQTNKQTEQYKHAAVKSK